MALGCKKSIDKPESIYYNKSTNKRERKEKMKIIATENKVVILNNVKSITLHQKNSTNWIAIVYFKNESESIDFGRDEEKAKETFKKIVEILSKND